MNNIGKELAHWYYESYEWEYFVWGEWKRVKAELHRQYVIMAAGLITILAAFGFLGFSGAGVLEAALAMMVLGLAIVGVIFLLFKLQYEAKRRWYRQMRRGAREVTITSDTVVIGEVDVTKSLIINIRPFGSKPSITISGGDFGVLTFVVRSPFSQGRDEVLRVLIPKGREIEAVDVVAELNRS